MRIAPALPLICISVTGDSPQQLVESARGALEYSRFVELRLDWLPNPAEALPLISRLLESDRPHREGRRAVLQATCRREPNGGRFSGSVETQLRILRAAIGAGCTVVDLEIESAEAAGWAVVENLRREALLILSWHDFDRTPPLAAVGRRLRQFAADFYKVVPTATRQSDNCVALDFLSSAGTKRDQWVVFCMGQAGVPSRVLALSRGSAFVYASSPREGTGNREQETDKAQRAVAAPGQIDYATLRGVYRAEKLTRQTALYGLLGYPVGHSLGVAIHNAAFRSRALDAVYLPWLSQDIKDFRKAAARYGLAGFSITIPHKQNVFRLLDRVDRLAKLAGAVNTVRVRRGRWEGINTDVEGIVAPLRKAFRLAEGKSFQEDFRAVVVGTGGAARAALVALRELCCRNVMIAGRNLAKAQELAKKLNGSALPLTSLADAHFDLMIHSTPVGMWPATDQSLLRADQISAGTVFDMVYNPVETRLLELARRRGCQTISGLEMFLAQAARQFEYWTGTEAPKRLMRKTAESELARFPQPTGECKR